MHSPTTDSNTEDQAVKASSTVGKVPSARRRLGQPAFAPESAPSPKAKSSVRKLAYPIFWVEAFNPAHQKWIAVDPIVTQTVNKPSKFEPPSSYATNQLSYVVAFESDGVARDVTRRYAKAFNAKTRRSRVENTENGSAWFRKTMRFFRRRGGALDREQVEDAELAQREAREGLPGNVLDFKDHPYYALERQLKRHEVIHPKREVGKVNAGTAAKPRMEAVFRRQDVLGCKSADKWFRVGRQVKEGEQPVKRVPARRPRQARSLSGDAEDGEEALTPLYALFQTTEYVPQPVVSGRVPRNAYGNLDIYVPSMVPAGGAHVRHSLAREAARILRIDCVDAVTGFQFKGRQGTAITDGVIVAVEFADAVRAILEGMEDEKTEEESRVRSAVALRMWKKFLVGLRIQERVRTYGDVGTNGSEDMDVDEMDEDSRLEAAGGFLPSDAADAETLPTAGRFSLVELSTHSKKVKRGKRMAGNEDSEEEAEFTNDGIDDDAEADYQPTRSSRSRRRVVEDDESDDQDISDGNDQKNISHASANEPDGGGMGDEFLPEDAMNEGSGGGFLPDDEGGGLLPDDATQHEDGSNAFLDGVADDGGGGFLLDDDVAMESPGDHRPAESSTPLNGTTSLVTDDNTSPAPHLTEFASNELGPDRFTSNTLVSETAAMPIDDPVRSDRKSSQPEGVTSALVQQNYDNEMDVEATSKAGDAGNVDKVPSVQGSESDHGSMLSHDPEDEDAEPDWLESD
jgi:xeroderma pigmentosum group C-complementing protein